MHFKDDPISDMHAKNYLIISCLKHFPGPTKFGPVFWSRLFRRGPVEYNYPGFMRGPKTSTFNFRAVGVFGSPQVKFAFSVLCSPVLHDP